MSNRLFQSVIHQMKDAVNNTIGVVDDGGIVISCSELTRIGETFPDVRDEILYNNEKFITGGYTFRPITSHTKSEYFVFVEGEDVEADSLSLLLSISLSQIKALYDEKNDKFSFIKNIILDNILPSDIYVKSKELHLNGEINRIVYLIKFKSKTDVVPIDEIQSIFPDRNKDFVISVGENDVVLVSELKDNPDPKEIEQTAKNIVGTISENSFVNVVVGIGTVVDNIKEIARSYKEAQVAIEVGKVFDTEKSVINYENLGIGRLIYQLPTTLCEMFLHEVFKNGALESLDRETLSTIQAFFANNLNVSETSRQLYVHRNTLVYRLDKIKKLTGLDLREFDHAITFKVALMVKRYLVSKPTKF